MARAPAATVVRLLAGLLTFAVLLSAPPLLAASDAPVSEEADEDIESVSSACPRRAPGAGDPPVGSRLPARFSPEPLRRAATPRAVPLITSGHVGPLPHPRC